MARVAGVRGKILSKEAWAEYLRDAGLEDVVARTHRMEMRKEARARLQRYPGRDTLDALVRLPKMWFGNPDARAFLRETFGGVKHVRKATFEYLGYGAYAGRKPAHGE
jgi:hypothetical protein